jgi:hypothetical protein
MENLLKDFRKSFSDRVIRLLWQQWSALGVAGYEESNVPWLFDPEALLLFSTLTARDDPRLFDEVMDWLDQNASWLNLQRINHLRKNNSLGEPTILAAIGEHLSKRAEHRKWRVFPTTAKCPKTGASPLFPGVPHYGATDIIFQKWGWLRSPLIHRSLSGRPRPHRASTFLFTLRSLFGRQSRAEIIAWLLANESGHPAEIARQTAYFEKSVQTVLNELELSGHIRSFRIGREKHFSLNGNDWVFLSPKETPLESTPFPQWLPWAEIFRLLANIYNFLSDQETEKKSSAVQSIELKRAFKQSKITSHSILKRFPDPQNITGSEFLSATFRELEDWLDDLTGVGRSTERSDINI